MSSTDAVDCTSMCFKSCMRKHLKIKFPYGDGNKTMTYSMTILLTHFMLCPFSGSTGNASEVQLLVITMGTMSVKQQRLIYPFRMINQGPSSNENTISGQWAQKELQTSDVGYVIHVEH